MSARSDTSIRVAAMNAELCRALGIKDLTNVHHVDVTIGVNEIPSMAVHCDLVDREIADNVEAVMAKFRCLPWTPGVEDVLRERVRQVMVKGYSPQHDDEHVEGELSDAAACYAAAATMTPDLAQFPPGGWPWESIAWNACSRRDMLVKAAALVIAEIDRLDRIQDTLAEEGRHA